MSSKLLIAVIGATGSQGGAVVDFLLKDGKYLVRGLTRDASSDKAKKLKEKGVEVIQGNAENKEDVKSFFKGAYGVYAMTDADKQGGKETQIGNLMADAAKEVGVKHYVWATQMNIERKTNGKYNLADFTDKAKVDDHIKEIGLPTTFFVPSAYYQNWFKFFPPTTKDDGTKVWECPLQPETLYETFDVDETGKFVVAALNDPKTWIGKYLNGVTERRKVAEYFEDYTKVTGHKVEYHYVSPDEYAKRGDDAPHVAETNKYVNEYNGLYDPKTQDWNNGLKLVSDLTSWSDWMAKNKSQYE